MKKQTKPKTKRTQVKELAVVQQELTTDEAQKVKGGNQTKNTKGSADFSAIAFVGGWGSSMYQ